MKKLCTRCIYDENIPGIKFDEYGVCNYCKEYDNLDREYPDGEEGKKIIDKLVKKMKYAGKNKKYDCVVGVSGGCDSSYLLYKVKSLGLRPLAVCFDNGWNAEVADRNLDKMIKALNVDLYVYKMDYEEYYDICKSFLKAGVADLEAAADVGIVGALYKAAEEYNIKYILTGSLFRTEGTMPLSWFYQDGKYIDSIQKQFGTCELKTFPNLKLMLWLKKLVFSRIKRIRLLYYVDYNKEEIKKFLSETFSWEWYGGHHKENIFTTFFLYYYLPKKFNRDLRVMEFSSLIRSGQMTREEAISKISVPPYMESETLEMVKDRLKLTDKKLGYFMSLKPKLSSDYKTYLPTFRKLKLFFWLMYKMNLVTKGFYIKYAQKGKVM